MNQQTAPSNAGEVEKLTSLLNQKPEINNKVEYYKAILKNNDLIVRGIEDALNLGSVTKTGRILWIIPFSITKQLSDYDRAKLLNEKIELEGQIYYQKKYFEDWLQRKNEYEVYFDKLSAECNERFDELYEFAKEQAKHNTRISEVVGRYKHDPSNQEKKNNFYLFLRQELKGKFMPKRETAS
jgi:hypothetical protein